LAPAKLNRLACQAVVLERRRNYLETEARLHFTPAWQPFSLLLRSQRRLADGEGLSKAALWLQL